MTGELEYSLPPAVRRISGAFRRFGWISFWAQAVLAVISSGLLLFATVSFSSRPEESSNPGAAAGLFLASLGLVAVYASAFWAFRYTRVGRRLRSRDATKRPTPKDAIQALRIGLIISMTGMLVTLLGGEALVGALVGKALTQPQGFPITGSNQADQYIRAFDIFIIQANINTLLAHFVALASTLWLLKTVNQT